MADSNKTGQGMRSGKISDELPMVGVRSRGDQPDYKNSRLSVDRRVSDLLSRMTVEEKVAQMLCIWGQKKALILNDQGKLSLEKIRQNLKNGIGQIGRLSDTGGGVAPADMAALANAIQEFLIKETRLGIPAILHEECLHGLAGKDATSYPQPIGLASTFDPELVEEIYTSIASDVRSRGAHQALTPVLDVAREPRWGRVEETFGEDPYLIAQLGIAAVKGFQGNSGNDWRSDGGPDGSNSNLDRFIDKDHVIATLKHFAAHGQPESGSNCGPVNISERLLRDVFLYPFKEVIEKGDAKSVMASYNEIDGVPSHANRWLLRDLLRNEWGFDGSVVSDYYAITELDGKEDTHSHSVANDKKEAALLAVKAGVNIELPDPDCYPHLTELIHDGSLDEQEIDLLVGPLLRQKFELGLFEDPFVDIDSIRNEERLERERELALRAARETITLLKNESGLLPLKLKRGGTIAVIGPNADRELLGGYSGRPKFYTTVLTGIKQKVGKNQNVLYSEGCKITVGGGWNEDAVTPSNPDEDLKAISEAVETAMKADVVVLVLGDNEQTSREAWSKTHLGDRASLELVGMQNELVKAVAETGKPVVAVLFNGRPISIGNVSSNVGAVLECWYLGQESGLAVADVLFGDYNPGGKLPISIPRSVGHIPTFYNHKPSARRGYLFDDISPLYQFGFGLSYSKFRITNPRLEKPVIRTDETTQMLVDVENSGDRGGDEVVQMYVRDVVSTVTRPVKELRGFARLYLKPGEKKTLSMQITPEHLSYTDINMLRTIDPGDFEIMVGNSSRDEDLLKVVLKVVRD